MAIPSRSDQTPGRSRCHLSNEHSGANHEQHPCRAGNHVQRNLLSAEYFLVGGCGWVSCHLDLPEYSRHRHDSPAIDRLQQRCSSGVISSNALDFGPRVVRG